MSRATSTENRVPGRALLGGSRTTRGAAVLCVMPASVMSLTANMTVTAVEGCQSMMPATPIAAVSMVSAAMTADARVMTTATVMAAAGVVPSAVVSAATVMAAPVTARRIGDGGWYRNDCQK